jgi:membrane protease YdiL (CAAX protease family)
VVPLFVLAVFLSMAYLLSGSLTVPVVMHALFNAWSLASCAIAGPLVRANGGDVAFLARSVLATTGLGP